MQQRIFHVTDIHCDGCRRAIHGALGTVEGIREVDADPRTNNVAVTFDERAVDTERISEVLADAGFPVENTSEAAAAESSAEQPAEGAAPGGARRHGARGGGAARYALLAAAVLVIALAGYVGYVLYPRFDLPAVQGAGLLGLAAAAGIASFFSPCSFPLLLGLLGRQATAQAKSGQQARPAVFGGALAAGAAAFMLLAGVVIALGGEALFAGVTFTSTAGVAIRSAVGVLLIVLGLIQLGRLPFSLHAVERLAQPIARRQAKLRRQRPVAGFALFGFGYVLAGFG